MSSHLCDMSGVFILVPTGICTTGTLQYIRSNGENRINVSGVYAQHLPTGSHLTDTSAKQNRGQILSP
jgi:hypothetical protein